MLTDTEHFEAEGEHIILISQDPLKDGIRGEAAMILARAAINKSIKEYQP